MLFTAFVILRINKQVVRRFLIQANTIKEARNNFDRLNARETDAGEPLAAAVFHDISIGPVEFGEMGVVEI